MDDPVLAVVSTVAATIIGVAVGGFVTWRVTSKALAVDIAARRVEMRHDRLLDARR